MSQEILKLGLVEAADAYQLHSYWSDLLSTMFIRSPIQRTTGTHQELPSA